jgi:hypothetical protein
MQQPEHIAVDTQGRILLFGKPVGIIRKAEGRRGDAAIVDSECQLLEINRFLLSRCRSVKFQPGLAKKLEQEALLEQAHLIRRARVYQLKPEIDPALRFIGYQELIARQGSVRPEDYALVFDGEVGSADPEAVYRLLRDHPPEEYRGHALTRSDVLELYNPKESRCFYVDTFALRPIRGMENAERRM